MAQVDECRAILEEVVREFDRRWRLELERVGQGLLRWLDDVLARMPCDTWRDEWDRIVANLARDQVFIEEESQKAFAAWINDANEAARRDAARAAASRFDDGAPPAAEGPSEDEPVLEPLPEDRLPPRLEKLLREILAEIEKLPPDQWLEEVRKLLDRLDLPPEIEARVLEYYTALHELWKQTWGLLHQQGPIGPAPARRETNQELLLRVLAGLDKLIAEGRLEELVDALRELVKRIPELMPEAMRGGELEELARELQALLNQFLDLLDALPPEAGEVAIEILQLALDIGGMFPGPGDVLDLIGAIISARRGEWLSVLISALALAPLAGIIAGLGKVSKRLTKLGTLIAKLKGPARQILRDFVEALVKAIDEIPVNSVRGALIGFKRFVERLRGLLDQTIDKLRKAKRKPRHVPKSRGVWDQPAVVRGEIVERRLGHNVPPGFKTIDRFENGVATSIKSIDLTAESYKNTERLTSKVKGQIDDVAEFKGDKRGWLKITRQEIKGRELLVAIPPDSPKAQRDALKALSGYARQKHVVLKVVEVK